MDDNKLLTLANGDRIRLLRHCAMLFEVFDLQYASPATISRCGMVYVDPKNLGYKPYFDRWVRDKGEKYSEVMAESLIELYTKYVPICIDRILEGTSGDEILEPFHLITPRTNLNMVQQLTTIFDSMIPPPDANPPQEVEQLEKMFIFCLTWSLGGALISEDRDKFSDFLRQTSGLMLPNTSLYDNQFDVDSMAFILWEKKVPDYVPPANRKFN
jgi:dynein heavy chain